MQGKSNFLANHIDDFVYRGVAWTPATTIYFGLLTCTSGIVARSTAYTSGQTVVVVTSGDNRYTLYACTTSGTTAASAPAYPGVVGEAITDGTAVFTEQTAVLKQGTAGATFTEVTGGSYARASLTSNETNWNATQGGTGVASTGTTGQISNAVAIVFPTSTAAWANAPSMVWATFTADALTAGNVYHIGSLATPVNIGSGVTPSLGIGAQTIQEL